MKAVFDKPIVFTLQLINSYHLPETDATVSYVILDNTLAIIIPSRSATYNTTTNSYTDTLTPSISWTTQSLGSYLVVWSVSNTVEEFSAIYTEDLTIYIDETKIDKILGLVHQNILIDNTIYDSFGNLTDARLRIYSDSASVGTNSNVLATYTINAVTTEAGQFSHWKQVVA